MLPAGAGAATSASFDDPVGDSTYYAADLGATKMRQLRKLLQELNYRLA